MQSLCRTTLFSKSGKGSTYDILVHSTCKAEVKSIDVLQENINGAKPRPYMFLDLLVEILPSRLYTGDYSVQLGENPVLNPQPGYTSHPCLVIYERGKQLKRYRLDQIVGTGWPVGVPSAHLRAMVSWWRNHRVEFNVAPHEWKILDTKV